MRLRFWHDSMAAWGGSFLKLGVPIGGLHNKDCSILGSNYMGVPYLGKLPDRFLEAEGELRVRV